MLQGVYEQYVEMGGVIRVQVIHRACLFGSELGTKMRDASLRGYTSAMAFQTCLTS